jgi:CrcB protein
MPSTTISTEPAKASGAKPADSSAFPLGTLLVNLSGSLLLGFIGGLIATHPSWPVTSIQSVAGVGFCATYTTFSSFIFETSQLWRQGNRRTALTNLCGQPVLGLLCAWVGVTLADPL